MKRPLCLFVFSFAVFCFIMQMFSVPPSQGAASVNENAPPDGSSVRIAGRLCKKEKKNEKQIYYLKEVQIISSDNFSQTIQMNQVTEGCGVICYMAENAGAVSDGGEFPGTGSLVREVQAEEPSVGAVLILRGTAASFEEAENEGQFDGKAYYKSQGYDFRMFRCRVLAAGEGFHRFDELLVDIKSKIRMVYETNMKPDNAGILCAMLIGDKTAMDAEIKNLYRKNGIAHVLAISGLHISLLGMLFYKLLRRIGMYPWLCSCFGIVLALVYIKFAGFSASAFRATCMFVLFLLADILGRTYDLKSAMAFSALLLCLKDPATVVQAGFLLSYLAVMGLAWVNPVLQAPVSRNEGIRRLVVYLKSNLLSGFSVQVFILPVSLWFYYEFPIGSFLLNLIIIPCMTFILISGLLGALPGCQMFLAVADSLLDFYEWLCLLAQQFPGAVIVTGRPAVWQMAVYYVLILLWLYVASPKRKNCFGHRLYEAYQARSKRRFPAFVFPLLCMLLFLIPSRQTPRVDMLSIGQGDCICMRDGKGKVVLLDGGSTDVNEAGTYRLLPFLKYNGISKISLVFLSHAHADHYSAVLELLEMSRSESVKVEAVCVSKLAMDNSSYADIVRAAQKAGTKIVYVGAGDQISCGDMMFDCVYPGAGPIPADENDASMILLARMHGFSMLFTGDSTEKCDAEVIRRLREMGISDICCLKAAHHGA
nr:DNA internalization-related competence protein ComEC/Rec2 [Lachnospiraceae bacterium]